MNRRIILAALVGTTFCTTLGWADIEAATLTPMDKKVDQAMAAYNAGDSKGFYANWAAQMKSIETPQTFATLYTDMYKKQYGNFKSKSIIKEKSVASGSNGLIVYKAVFSKKPGTLSVNFFQEGGVYKIQQIQINP